MKKVMFILLFGILNGVFSNTHAADQPRRWTQRFGQGARRIFSGRGPVALYEDPTVSSTSPEERVAPVSYVTPTVQPVTPSWWERMKTQGREFVGRSTEQPRRKEAYEQPLMPGTQLMRFKRKKERAAKQGQRVRRGLEAEMPYVAPPEMAYVAPTVQPVNPSWWERMKTQGKEFASRPSWQIPSWQQRKQGDKEHPTNRLIEQQGLEDFEPRAVVPQRMFETPVQTIQPETLPQLSIAEPIILPEVLQPVQVAEPVLPEVPQAAPAQLQEPVWSSRIITGTTTGTGRLIAHANMLARHYGGLTKEKFIWLWNNLTWAYIKTLPANIKNKATEWRNAMSTESPTEASAQKAAASGWQLYNYFASSRPVQWTGTGLGYLGSGLGYLGSKAGSLYEGTKDYFRGTPEQRLKNLRKTYQQEHSKRINAQGGTPEEKKASYAEDKAYNAAGEIYKQLRGTTWGLFDYMRKSDF